jgi:hypothetical protein
MVGPGKERVSYDTFNDRACRFGAYRWFLHELCELIEIFWRYTRSTPAASHVRIEDMRSLLSFLVFSSSTLSFVASADPIDGYINTSFDMNMRSKTNDSGTRVGGKIEFGRINRNFALDFRFAKGLDYSDFGFAPKLFGTWYFHEYFAFQGGAELGLSYSSGIVKTGVVKQSFSETFAGPFARLLFDSQRGVGVVLNVGYDYVFSRRYNSTAGADGRSDTTPASLINFGLGIIVDM